MSKKVGDLKPWSKNPRKITASKERILSKTINEFGDLSGIVFNIRNNALVGGHQRQKILESAEIEIVERYKKPNKHGTVAYGFARHDTEVFAYREVDWDDKTHAAAAIAANKGAGEWDMFHLKDLFVGLDDGMFDFEKTGFELPEIENLLAAYKPQEEEGVNDPNEEYEGMPEYEHTDDTPFKKLIVKFENQENIADFVKKLGINITETTTSIWYPKRERRDFTNVAYDIDEEIED